MSINSSETTLTSNNSDINKREKFYQHDSKGMKILKSCLDKIEWTRNIIFLIIFTVINIAIGVGTVVAICFTIFDGTHWKHHSMIRKVTRTCVISFHYIILPIICVVLMWLVYYKRQKSTDRKCCSCILDCSVFRPIDGLKPNKIPQINSNFQEDDVKTSEDVKMNYYNVGHYLLIGLHFIIPIFYIGHGICQLVVAIQRLSQNAERQSNEDFTSNDIKYANWYFGCMLGFLLPNFILVIPTLIYVINLYLNLMYKSARLRQLLMKNDDSNQSKEAILYVLNFFQSSNYEASRKLFLANVFSSVYILAIVLFDAGYLLYLFIEELTNDYLRWASIGLLAMSGLFLLIIMVITNKHIDQLKIITLLMYSISQVSKQPNTKIQSNPKIQPTTKTQLNTEIQTKPNYSTFIDIPLRTLPNTQDNGSSTVYDPICLQTIMNYFDCYAPQLSALAALLLAQAITIIVPFILKGHNIINENESSYMFIDIY